MKVKHLIAVNAAIKILGLDITKYEDYSIRTTNMPHGVKLRLTMYRFGYDPDIADYEQYDWTSRGWRQVK